MRKITPILLALTFGISMAQAAPMQVFHPSENADHPCKLAKSVGGKWILADGKELEGHEFASNVSKANGDFSNFKYNGTWYAVRTECLQEAGSGGDSSSGSGPSAGKKYYVELRGQKYLMMGAGASGGPSGTAGQALSPLVSGIGIGARLGYYWREDKVLFLDVNTLSAAQTTTFTGSTSGDLVSADSILTINIGYQMPFKSSYFGLVPYVAGSVGYAKYTETQSGTLSPGGLTSFTYGTSTFDVKVEGGVTYSLTSHLDGVFNLAYTYLTIGTKTVTDSNIASSIGKPITNPIGYSYLTTALGVRYSF